VNSSERAAAIQTRLTAALAPQRLEVVDESHQHVGHAGAKDGKSHFRILIVAERFQGLRPLARHRLVYHALGDLMANDIHALGIDALTPAEFASQ
jgi:BolA protein